MNKKRSIAVWIIVMGLACLNTGFARSDLELTGIVAGKTPRAMIGAQMVKEGDEVDGITVVKIGEETVTFKYKDEVFTRKVGEKIIETGEAERAISPARPQPDDVDTLIRQLKDKDRSIREKAVKALSKTKDPRAGGPLIDTLKDKDKDVRIWAVIALGELGDPRAVEPLIGVLNDRDDDVRRWTLESLGKVGGPAAVKALADRLKDGTESDRKLSALSLGKTGDAGAVDPLIVALQDGQESVREGAAKALGELGNLRAVEALSGLAVNDERWNVQRAAIEALGRIGGRCVVEPLIAVLKDKAPKHQFRDYRALITIAALNRIGDPRAAGPLIDTLKGHWDDWRVQAAAADALVNIKDLRATEHLVDVLKNNDPYVRSLARDILKKITGQDLGENHDAWSRWLRK